MAQSSAPGQLALLIASARTRFVRRYGQTPAGLTVGFVLALGALVLLGLAVVPTTVTRGTPEDPGGTVLEMAFWLTCLASAVTSFRVMEALYRTGDVHLLAPLPVRPSPLFAYRMLGRLFEAVLVALCGSALFVPVLWRGDAALFGACAWVWFTGLVSTAVLGMAVQLYAGVSNVRGSGDLGVSGQAAFTMAPGLALGISVAFILLQKLVAEEFLRGGLNRGAQVGISASLGAIAVSAVLAWRWFTTAFYPALAAFLQGDLYVVDVGYEYFKEGPLVPRGWERIMPVELVPLVRRDQLQYRRRYTLARLLVWLVAVGLAVLLLVREGESLPRGLLLGLPMIVLVVFANPWGRLYASELERGMSATLPLAPGLHHRAKGLVAMRETATLAAVLALAIALGLAFGELGWKLAVIDAALALSVPLSASSLLLLAARRRPGAALALGAAIALCAVATASIAPLALLGLDLVMIGAVYAMPSPVDRIEHPDIFERGATPALPPTSASEP